LTVRGKDSYSIHSVENALDVLEALCEEPEDIQISRLSEKLGMNKTSVFRLLATFENRGYVEKEEQTGKYRLGLSAYEIGQKLLSRMVLLRKARPVMERFARDCNEAVYLVVRRDDQVLFLDLADTTQQVKIITLVGQRFPLDSTAAGMVLTAHLPADDPAHRTLPGDQRLSIQSRGYCIDADALGEGITSLAVPLFGSGGIAAGCLCCVGPSYRLEQGQIEKQLLPSLKEACLTVSNKLGYSGPYLPRSQA